MIELGIYNDILVKFTITASLLANEHPELSLFAWTAFSKHGIWPQVSTEQLRF